MLCCCLKDTENLDVRPAALTNGITKENSSENGTQCERAPSREVRHDQVSFSYSFQLHNSIRKRVKSRKTRYAFHSILHETQKKQRVTFLHVGRLISELTRDSDKKNNES